MVEAYVGVGSNLGDRRANLVEALQRLAESKVVIDTKSSIYESAAILFSPQPDFLNVVVRVYTSSSAQDLLAICLGVEEQMGRVRSNRWGPRNIDLDLILYGNTLSDQTNLILPHPGLKDRPFVIIPLLEIAPNVTLPGGEPASLLLTSQMHEAVRKVGRLDLSG